MIKSKAAEVWLCSQNKLVNLPPLHVNSHITVSSWKKPAAGWFNISIDGSMKNNHIAARGVIINENGQWYLGFAKSIGLGDVDKAEAWALQIGLEQAARLLIKKIRN